MQGDWLEELHTATRLGVMMDEIALAYKPKRVFNAGCVILGAYGSGDDDGHGAEGDTNLALERILCLAMPGKVVQLPIFDSLVGKEEKRSASERAVKVHELSRSLEELGRWIEGFAFPRSRAIPTCRADATSVYTHRPVDLCPCFSPAGLQHLD